MSRADEAFMPPDMVQRVLDQATGDVVLIGGQALAFWMGHYGIRQPVDGAPAISRDVDFFTAHAGDESPLRRFAQAIGGHAYPTPPHGLSALVGSAIAPAGDGRIYNVDLLHKVVGLTRSHVRENAVEVDVGGGRILHVLHPIDVLQSRNANLHELAEKQDEAGCLQLRLAIEVARRYLEEAIDAAECESGGDRAKRDRAVLRIIADVAAYAREDAARKNADRYGIFLADAIPAWRIASPAFRERQWPRLRRLMSPAYAGECESRAARESAER